jgi:hypothetical protein
MLAQLQDHALVHPTGPVPASSALQEGALGRACPTHPRSDPLDDGLVMLGADRPGAADRILTAALLADPGRSDLWLAAGIARLRRGARRSAAAALRMCAWIADEPLARELLREVER